MMFDPQMTKEPNDKLQLWMDSPDALKRVYFAAGLDTYFRDSISLIIRSPISRTRFRSYLHFAKRFYSSNLRLDFAHQFRNSSDSISLINFATRFR